MAQAMPHDPNEAAKARHGGNSGIEPQAHPVPSLTFEKDSFPKPVVTSWKFPSLFVLIKI